MTWPLWGLRSLPVPIEEGEMSIELRLIIPLLSVLWLPVSVEAQELQNLSEGVEQARINLSEMRSIYLGDEELGDAYELESRLQEGLVLLEQGDPDRASVLFLDIVSRDEWRGRAGYRQALFLQARALFESGYYESAREQLLLVIEDGRPEDYQDAVRYLIEVGIKTKNWSGIEEIYEKLERTTGSEAEPELLYARAKGLYAEKRYEEAVATLSRIDPVADVGLKSRYFLGVSRARLGKFDEALEDFLVVIDSADSSIDEERELMELAYLARGRLFYEKEQWGDAVDTYQHIPRGSVHFDQALYEITWTHVKEGENRLALRNLEILVFSRPDSVFIPEAKRLSADLLKDLGEFGRALAMYEEILSDFSPTLEELDLFTEGSEDKLKFFQNLVSEDHVGRAQYLPSSAQKWVKPTEEMKLAAGMISSLGKTWENVKESREIIEEISAAIEGTSRFELFSSLRGAWVSAVEYEGMLLGLLAAINDYQVEKNGEVAATAERREYGKAFAELPNSQEAFLTRERVMQAALEQRSLRAYRLRSYIEGAEVQIEAIQHWRLVKGNEQLSAEEDAKLEQDLVDAEVLLDEMNAELSVIEREIRLQASLGGIDAEASAKEAELRKNYRLALLKEYEELAGLRPAGDAEGQQLDALVKKIGELEAGLDNFRGEVIAVVEDKLKDVRSRLKAETAILEQSSVRYDQLHGDVELVAGEIAFQQWSDARQLFAELVLGADVGVVDVAWLKKESTSRYVDQLIEERNKEREILEQDFEQLKKELGQDGTDNETK